MLSAKACESGFHSFMTVLKRCFLAQGIEAFAHLDPFLLAVALTYGSRACNNLHWTETDLGRFSQERDSFVLVKRHRIVQNFDDVHMCSQVNAPVSQDLE